MTSIDCLRDIVLYVSLKKLVMVLYVVCYPKYSATVTVIFQQNRNNDTCCVFELVKKAYPICILLDGGVPEKSSFFVHVYNNLIFFVWFRFLQDAGGYNDWPIGRGIFFNDNKTFLCWVNEEDHLRLISMQKGGDLASVYKRLINVSEQSTDVSTDRHVCFCLV